MGLVKNMWDGLLSLGAALASLVIVGVPVWSAHLAISYGLFPAWGYAPVAALVVIGGIMVIAFLRKASGGIAPFRERRRR